MLQLQFAQFFFTGHQGNSSEATKKHRYVCIILIRRESKVAANWQQSMFWWFDKDTKEFMM